jgi:AraC-like DNA-binding protein
MDRPDQDLPGIDILAVGMSLYPPGSSFGPAPTRGYELVWIEEGGATVDSGGPALRLAPGSVLLTAPGVRITYRWDESTTTRHGYVVFAADAVPVALSVVHELPEGDVALALLRHLVWLDTQRPPLRHPQSATTAGLALLALSQSTLRATSSQEAHLPRVVSECLRSVREQWRTAGSWRTPPLASLAAAAAVTPEHLVRAFTREVGCGPVTALRAIRLQRSALLLRRSNHSVGQIAALCGFDNPFHYSRAFKAAYGVAPTAFRRQDCAVEAALPPPLRRLTAHL